MKYLDVVSILLDFIAILFIIYFVLFSFRLRLMI